MLLLFMKLEFCPWQKIALPQDHIEIGFYALPLKEGDFFKLYGVKIKKIRLPSVLQLSFCSI